MTEANARGASDGDNAAALARAREQLTAVADVLKTISRSRFELQPVLDVVLQNAVRLCGADTGSIVRLHDGFLRPVADVGAHHADEEAFREYWSAHAVPQDPSTLTGRVLLERRSVAITDMQSEPGYRLSDAPGADPRPNRSALGVPLVREGEVLGVLVLRRFTVRPFSEQDMRLVETFADQAAIAIENVRLLTDTKDALERQTALSDILRVIAESPSDQQPVLDAIAVNAARFCGAADAIVLLVRENELHVVAHHGPIPTVRQRPLALERTAVAGRAVLERRTFHIADVHGPEGDEFPQARDRGGPTGQRAMLAAPMVREGQAIGAILLRKQEPIAFTPNQIQLVEAFADQAVIAIENVRLANETKEALEQQTATADVLKTISRSAFDLQSVFDVVVENALSLCRGDFSYLYRRDGNVFRIVAWRGGGPELLAYEKANPTPITRSTLIGRVALERQVVHIPDQFEDAEYDWPSNRAHGVHTLLGVPAMRDDDVVAVIGVARTERRPFSAEEIRLMQTFADQSAIAIENVRLFNETKDALERQTAISEILRAIARSPGDEKPVLATIAYSATTFCGAQDASILLIRDGKFGFAAHHGPVLLGSGSFQIPMTRESVAGHAVIERRTVQVADVLGPDGEAYPPAKEGFAETGQRAILATPLLREDQPIGAIVLRKTEPGAFSASQVNLVEAFADQAVIAIENVRLFNETKEALERQTSISEVLETIGRSAFDLQPVLDTVVERAARLCEADYGSISTLEGDLYRTKAYWGTSTVPHDYIELMRAEARPRGRGTLTGRTALEGRVIHIHDVLGDPEYTASDMQQAGGYRTLLGVPLLRDGEVIGVFALCRNDVKPFTERQIDLVRTFGDQAAIAIENVRLFNETKESLERQTALAEILRVIADSPSDRQPVLDAVARSATRYCGAEDAVVFLVDGNELRRVAHYGSIPMRNETAPLDERGVAPHAILTRRTIHVADIESAEGDHYPTTRAYAADSGRRGSLAAPLMREGTPIGVILLRKMEPTGFTPSQIRLVEAFADQAMIALENVRLFNETKEALDQQTAVSDVLKTISRSAFDLRPVLDIVLNNAVRLAGADIGWMARVENDQFSTVSYSTEFPQSVRDELFRRRAQGNVLGPWVPLGSAGGLMGFTLAEGRTVHLPDVKEDPELKDSVIVRMTSSRTVVGVPMLREGRSIGGMVLARYEVRPFSDRELELVQTFADQAAIAIENVRLFNETKEALDRQTAVAQVLGEISHSGFELRPVLETVIEHATKLCAAQQGFIYRREGEVFRLAVAHGITPEFEAFTEANPINPMGRGTVTGRVVEDGRTVHVPDVLSDPEYTYWDAQRLGNFRAILGVPMMRDDEVIGVMLLWRTEPQPFTEQEIALVTTFANQATIAIENVRLFNETKEALERQTAIGEVLSVISRSTADVLPVMKIVLSNAVRLCDADFAWMRWSHRGFVEFAYAGRTAELQEEAAVLDPDLPRDPATDFSKSIMGRTQKTGARLHVEDITTDEELYRHSGSARKLGARTVVAVPVFTEAEMVAVIVLARRSVRSFSDRELAILQTFADQGAIAIRNVRQFNEIQDKSRQLEVASRHKSEFLANMSHELRTPLNAIIGFSEVLVQGLFGDVNEKQREYLQDVIGSGHHLLSLINDILDLSKIEAGRMELELTTFSLRDALNSGLTIVRERAGRHNIAINAVVADDLGQLEADERKVKQIFYNLLSNAVKFTPDGGRVDVVARRDNGDARIEVRDSGIGIAKEDQARIFEEFQQVGRERSREGTGLGLTLTRRFVELHGGRISLDSAPGKGSTFTFTLPLRQRGPVPA